MERLSVCGFDLRLQNRGVTLTCARQFSALARAIMLFQDTGFKWPSIRREAAADLPGRSFFNMSVCRHRRCNVCVMILSAAMSWRCGRGSERRLAVIPNLKFRVLHMCTRCTVIGCGFAEPMRKRIASSLIVGGRSRNDLVWAGGSSLTRDSR